MFRRYIDRKAKERKEILKKYRVKAMKELRNTNMLPLNSGIFISNNTIETQKDVMLTCIYKYSSDLKEPFKTGFLWGTVYKDCKIKPLTLWDKYGRFIADRDLVNQYCIYCIVPSISESMHSIFSTYVIALQYGYVNDKTDLDSGLLDLRDISLKTDDNDLRLVIKRDNYGTHVGLTTNDGVLKGLFLDTRDCSKVVELSSNCKTVGVNDIIDLYKQLLYDYEKLNMNETNKILTSLIIEQLEKCNGKLKNCNMYHILLLLGGFIKLKVNYIESDNTSDKRTCRLINRYNINGCNTPDETDTVNHLILNLLDLKLCYHDRYVKIDFTGVTNNEKENLLRNIINTGEIYVDFK